MENDVTVCAGCGLTYFPPKPKTCASCGTWLVDPVMALMDVELQLAQMNAALQEIKIGIEHLAVARIGVVGAPELGELSVWQVAAASPSVARLLDAVSGLVEALGGEMVPAEGRNS